MTALDVQIVAYGDSGSLLECVESVASLEPMALVVVDHLGNAPIAQITKLSAAQVTRTRVDETNPGFGAGHNRALGLGRAPFVLLLNPDARVCPDGVRLGIDYLARHPAVGAVQGRISNDLTGETERSQGVELGPIHLLGRAASLRRWLNVRAVRRIVCRVAALRDHVDRLPPTATPVESLAATALLTRREALEAVRGFDESYFLYGEDLDLCRRLRAAGWSLVAIPDSFAVHRSGGSSTTAWNRELQWWQGTLQFAANWWSTRRLVGAIACGGLAAVRLVVRRPTAIALVVRALLLRPIRLRMGRPSLALRS